MTERSPLPWLAVTSSAPSWVTAMPRGPLSADRNLAGARQRGAVQRDDAGLLIGNVQRLCPRGHTECNERCRGENFHYGVPPPGLMTRNLGEVRRIRT
ncbi:MAG: hypothetical protein WDN04_20805 [Rhodospirillales bacterium]